MGECGYIEQVRYTCAIGALQTVVAIPRALPILHSGPGCGEMVSGFYERSRGYAGGTTMPCSNFSEKEVVFGGIEKLRNIIKNSYKVLDTDLQVVLTGCTAGIVGDDVDGLVEEFREEGRPIVSVDTPGFKGNNFESHSRVVNAIIDQYVFQYEEENEARSEKNTVNLFASIPYQDPFWEGNLREYKRLLERIGLKVHVLFGSESAGVLEWQHIPRANFNILISPWYGKPIVEHLEKKYGQPYCQFPYVPIGANETEKFLKKVIKFAVENEAIIDHYSAQTFLKKEKKAYYEQIDNLATFRLDFYYGLPNHVHIIHDAGYVLGLSKFLLYEVGIVPKEQFIVDNTPEKYKEEILQEFEHISEKRKIEVTFDPDAGSVQRQLRTIEHEGRGLLIGAGWDKKLAEEKDLDYLPAALPANYRITLNTNYAGFSGGLRVIEDIYNRVLATYN